MRQVAVLGIIATDAWLSMPYLPARNRPLTIVLRHLPASLKKAKASGQTARESKSISMNILAS